MAWGAALQKGNHVPHPIKHKESGLRLWSQAYSLLVFKYIPSYNIIIPHEWRLGLSKTAWSLPSGAGREAGGMPLFHNGIWISRHLLPGSRGLKQIEMYHPNASLLSILTSYYCLVPKTDVMGDMTTAMLSSLLLTCHSPFSERNVF